MIKLEYCLILALNENTNMKACESIERGDGEQMGRRPDTAFFSNLSCLKCDVSHLRIVEILFISNFNLVQYETGLYLPQYPSGHF